MIYFLQAGKNGPIKIGCCEDVLRDRVTTLQVGNPYKLTVLFIYNGREYTELELHELFQHENIRGEWFRPAREILGFRDKHREDCYGTTPNELYECRTKSAEFNHERWYKKHKQFII